ncbi:MAG: RNA polymerase sigma factor [Dehalococcoidia bacterium]
MGDQPPNGAPDRRRAEDEALARRASAGDADAWSEIFERHYRTVYGFVRYRLRQPEEAEDIAAQVFEVAYARASSFDYRGVPIEAWLMGIARNLVRDQAKKHMRRGPHEELDEQSAGTAAGEAPAVELRHDLEAAMRHLTEDQQTVLALRFLLDKSVAETAAIMNRSEDAVKNLQRRALAAMGRALGDAGYLAGGAS